MRYSIIFLLFLFTIAGCSRKEVEYNSTENDLADISLRLQPDNSFRLSFRSFPDEAEEMEQENKQADENGPYIFEGTWTSQDGFYHLTFRKDKKGKPDLNALFDRNYDTESVLILNNNTIKFRDDSEEIFIWGISCAMQVK